MDERDLLIQNLRDVNETLFAENEALKVELKELPLNLKRRIRKLEDDLKTSRQIASVERSRARHRAHYGRKKTAEPGATSGSSLTPGSVSHSEARQ